MGQKATTSLLIFFFCFALLSLGFIGRRVVKYNSEDKRLIKKRVASTERFFIMKIDKSDFEEARKEIDGIKFKRFIFQFKMESKTGNISNLIIIGNSYHKNDDAADKDVEAIPMTKEGEWIDENRNKSFANIEMRETDIKSIIPSDGNYTYVRLTPKFRVNDGYMIIIAEAILIKDDKVKNFLEVKGRKALDPSPPAKPQ